MATPTISLCEQPYCGRASAVAHPKFGRLCQTHAKHVKTGGAPREIRPYRKRQPDTVKFSGLRLKAYTVTRLKLLAKRRRIALGAAVASVLDGLAKGEQVRL